ncbi:MAG: MBL fold metallo-hydrolase [Sphingobacteriales bacterium]|nr:MAG: MBL fold metallo-hydrolase [Sphingobacteriales bacterium]
MKFELTILGSSSATPIFQRNPTAQILNINEKIIMIDCGEGTQQQMLRFGIKFNKIDSIFISHLHGDHFFGLVGLLSSMNLNGRVKALNLYCPVALKEILDIQFLHSGSVLRFPLNYFFTQTTSPQKIVDTPDYIVETIILNHRIPCTGFLFTTKKAFLTHKKAFFYFEVYFCLFFLLPNTQYRKFYPSVFGASIFIFVRKDRDFRAKTFYLYSVHFYPHLY